MPQGKSHAHTSVQALQQLSGITPVSHLALELTLLPQAQVFWGVGHDGERLFRVVPAEGIITAD